MGIRICNGPVPVGCGAGYEHLRAEHPAGLREDPMAGDQRAIAREPKRHIIQQAGPVANPAFFILIINHSCKKNKNLYVKTPATVCNRVMEDKLLIWKFKRGNREALRRIYDKHHGHLLKLAVMLTGNVDTAEDIVQEVFVNFARSAGRFGLIGNLKNYLITSTLNCVRNIRRDSRRRKLQNLDDAEQILSVAKRPDQWAVLSERLEHLSSAVFSLPYEQREVITLRFEENMTFRQIAGLQKTSISTVHGRYRYGIEKLRSLLNSEVKA